MQIFISISLNLFRVLYCSFHYIPEFFFNFICMYMIFDRVSLPLRVGGLGQNRFVSQDKGGMYCCNRAARFYRFSLSAVGVVALATATAVQLVGGGRRLAVPGGAVEAAPHTQFGSFHPRAVGVGF